MSTTETILTRMMNDTTFADSVFNDAVKALAEYSLSVEDVAKFKGLTHAEYDALVSNPEERKSFGILVDERGPRDGTNHNETLLK